VCKGIEDYANHKAEEAAAKAAAKAAIQASIEAWQDAEFARDDILSRLQKKYQLDEAAAAEYYEQFSAKAVNF
jgi:hypothetical protein